MICAEELNATAYTVKRNYYYFSYPVHIMLCICYVIIVGSGMIGSLTVWLTIPFDKNLRTPMNYLLLNLSLAHLIANANVLLFCFVLDTGYIATSQPSRDTACAFTEGLGIYFIGAGTYLLTLCAISFNRFMAIQYPTRQSLRMQKKSVVFYNFAVWIVATIWIMPSMISFKYNWKIKICLRDWGLINPIVYRISALLWSIVLPLSFLFLSFAAIIWRRKEDSVVLNHNASLNRKLNLQKAEKLLGYLILSYLITWMPFFIYWILYTTDYFNGCAGEISAMKWLRITVLVSTVNSVLDPFIYVHGSKEHKKVIYRLFVNVYFKMSCRKLGRVRADTDTSSHRATLRTTAVPDPNENIERARIFLVSK